MPPHRTTPLLLAILVAASAAAFAAAAGAHTSALPRSTSAAPARLVFPVIGHASFFDDFGAARGQGGHQGNDILAQRQAPVVAVEAGSVELWTRSPGAGCMLYLHGESGTSYQYVHLNNDLTVTNDNKGSCVDGVAYASGLHDGQSVRAGQLLGYVGDSGDADGMHPHLHFELHPGDGAAVSPYRWLRRARHRAAALPAGP